MVDGVSVILNEVKNLVVTIGCSIEILRLTPQNDIVTQSPRGEGTRQMQHESVESTNVLLMEL
jgi:hypothetical protein